MNAPTLIPTEPLHRLRRLLIAVAAGVAVLFHPLPALASVGHGGDEEPTGGDTSGMPGPEGGDAGLILHSHVPSGAVVGHHVALVFAATVSGMMAEGAEVAATLTPPEGSPGALSFREGPPGVFSARPELSVAGLHTVSFTMHHQGMKKTQSIQLRADRPSVELHERVVEFATHPSVPVEGQEAELRVTVKDHDGNPLTGQESRLRLRIRQPGTPAAAPLELEATAAPGIYEREHTFGEHGDWNVTVHYDLDGDGQVDEHELASFPIEVEH